MAVLVISLLAHVVALTAIGVDTRAVTTAETTSIDIRFSVASDPRSAAPSHTVVEEPAARADPERAAPQKSRAAVPESSVTAASLKAAVQVEIGLPSRETRVPVLNLDPSSAARAFHLSQQTLPQKASGSEALAENTDSESRNYFEGAGEKKHLSQREPPELQRRRDGSYRYRGHAFKATIARDGSVDFDDGYQQGTKIAFDVTDMLMRRRGEDPYRVEKRWFLESTEALRDELIELWRVERERHALLKLRGRLNRVAEDRTLSDHQKAVRFLAMYQATTDDDKGIAARDVISEFVAESMPGIVLPNRTD
jgi:hypothetical protein